MNSNTQMERCPDCGSDNKAERLDMTDEGNIFDYPCTHHWHSTPAAPETAPQREIIVSRSGEEIGRFMLDSKPPQAKEDL